MNPETPKQTPTPEEALRSIGAHIVLGEWRFPFYGKDTVAQMLPLDEWIERLRSYRALLEAAKIVSDGMNTAVDNDEHWTRQQMRAHLFAIQSAAVKAIAIAEGARS